MFPHQKYFPSAMGVAGIFVGILFFVNCFIFATLSSCISVTGIYHRELYGDFSHEPEKQSVILLSVYLPGSLPAVIALRLSQYFYGSQLPNGSTGQLLDIMDYISNSVMMPFIALLFHDPDWLDRVSILRHRRNGTEWRENSARSFIGSPGPLCYFPVVSVYSFPAVNQIAFHKCRLFLQNAKRRKFIQP